MQYTCAFSGHRPERLPWGTNQDDPRCVVLKSEISKAVKAALDEGFSHFIFGAARGSDMYFLDAVLELRREGITIEAAIPFAGQCERWPREDQRRYYSALEKCDKLTLLQHEYSTHCMARRNRYMVDNAGYLVAVYGGGRGGTISTIEYARSLGRRVLILPPDQ